MERDELKPIIDAKHDYTYDKHVMKRDGLRPIIDEM
jgi:hypothetical protein